MTSNEIRDKFLTFFIPEFREKRSSHFQHCLVLQGQHDQEIDGSSHSSSRTRIQNHIRDQAAQDERDACQRHTANQAGTDILEYAFQLDMVFGVIITHQQHE